MEWVIALLAIGCLFLAFHIGMNYIKVQRLLGPRSRRLEATRKELDGKIEREQQGLEEDRHELQPLRDEVNQIDSEFHQRRRQTEEERKGQRLPPGEEGGD